MLEREKMAGAPCSVWIIMTAFLCLPCESQSLLSDFKICGDPACESLMGRVQALRDHQSDDCRFLSFRQGDTIFVYHKLTGRRKDLWAGTIDKRFGYFPKDLVQEEQAYAVMEKVVEARKEDFFCMDEFGYPIDSSHLDNDDEQINGKIQSQESELKTPPTDGSLLRSTDPSPQPSAKEVQVDQDKNNEDAIEETIDSSVVLKNQESVSSSTWLSSSVTGWLGLTRDEEPSNMVEAEKEDEKKEIASQTSLTSSLTGWLSFTGETEPDNTKEIVKHEETHDSVSSTKKGNLELETIDIDTEREKQEETYRARKISLDLEGNQSNDEGKKVEQEEESRSSSWLDMGMGMLGLKKDSVGDEEMANGGIEEIENGEVKTESQHTEITQPKPVLANDPVIGESKTVEPVKTKLVSSMSQTSGNNEKVEDFKGHEEENDSIEAIRPVDIAAEDHQRLKAVSNDPEEGLSVDRTGSVNGSDQDAEHSLNPNNRQSMGQTDNDEKKQDLSSKNGTDGPGYVVEESSEQTLNHSFEVQNSAEENQDGGQSHVPSSFGKYGLIQDETKNDTSDATAEIKDYEGIDTSSKILDQEDATKPIQSSSQESGVRNMGLKVVEEQEIMHDKEDEIKNLRETDEILEEKPSGKTELKRESEERKLDVMELEGIQVEKKQEEVQKFNEMEKLANMSEEETEEEVKGRLTSKAELEEIKEEGKQIELEKLQEKDTGVEGKQVYNDLGTPELESVPQQKIILETLLAEDEEKNQGKEIHQDEVKEKETETVNQAERINVENNSQVCSHGMCPNSSNVGPEEDGDKGTVKDGGSHSKEILRKEKDLPDRTNEKIRVHPGKEENTPSLEEGTLESHDLDSEVQKEGRGSLGERTWNIFALSKDSRIASTESSRTPNDGTFTFLKNTMGLFSQTSDAETKDSPQVQTPVVKPSEEPLMEASGTPEKDLHSTMNSSPNQHTDPDSPKRSPQLHPLPVETSVNESTQDLENLIQIQDLSKSYPNLLVHVSREDIAVMLEKLGPQKLESLELSFSDTDGDLSIVLDIERLLQNHIEKLLVPSSGDDIARSEDKEKTKTLIVLQKMEMLLEEIRKTFNNGQVDLQDHPDEEKWVDPSSSSNMNSIEESNVEDSRRTEDYPEEHEEIKEKNGWMSLDKEQNHVNIATEAPSVSEEVNIGSSSGQRASLSHSEQGSPTMSKEVRHRTFSFLNPWAESWATHTLNILELPWFTEHVVSVLPKDLRPGPDMFGMPWEPVIIACVVGLLTILLFSYRCYSSLKSRMYRSKEHWLSEQIAQLLDEKCNVLETLSQCQQEYDELQSSLEDSGAEAQMRKAEQLEERAEQLQNDKNELETDVLQLKDEVDQQRDCRIEQETRIAVLEQSMQTFEEEIKDLQSQDEQAQTTLKVYSMNSERLQRNLDTAGGENAVLQETNAHLRQQVEGWAERVSELEAEIRRCEMAHSGMMQDVATKDQRITSLTDRLLKMKAWDSDVEKEEVGEGEKNGGADVPDGHLQKVQKLIYAAKLNADLKSVDEDKDRVFAKLNDEVKAKEDLQDAIKDMESEKLALQSEAENYTSEVQRLQQKLQIMTEMYQENELKLHRMLTVEEKERLHKEEKLNKADKNIALAMEELNNYRQRAGEMEEELDKTKQSYQTQISAHEKKAHNNWLAARAADRELTDIRRENALLRQKLTDTQFKLDALDKDPYALESLAHPLPFRGERSPYGRPGSETRGFLSPPTLMEAPPPRLSPRVPRGPGEPSGGHSELERSGGPHSDSGSSSPTWEKDRRGPPPGPIQGPPGYMFTDPGAPMFRRPPPPGRGFPPGPPHPTGMADESYRESVRAAEEHGPPPEADPRMGGPPPMGPMDAPFPRRAAYRPPPPPDFFPPRGPGGPPMIPVWALPPSGMMPPLRYPPPNMPPMRLPPPSMAPLPPFQHSFPPPPHNQPPQDSTAPAEDSI